jgi:hypothetical protein
LLDLLFLKAVPPAMFPNYEIYTDGKILAKALFVADDHP